METGLNRPITPDQEQQDQRVRWRHRPAAHIKHGLQSVLAAVLSFEEGHLAGDLHHRVRRDAAETFRRRGDPVHATLFEPGIRLAGL